MPFIGIVFPGMFRFEKLCSFTFIKRSRINREIGGFFLRPLFIDIIGPIDVVGPIDIVGYILLYMKYGI
jgi:hypothetical protein